jgi:hypothetical protein
VGKERLSPIDRREFLVAGLASPLALLGCAGGGTGSTGARVTLDDFLALSLRLTERPRLDAAAARVFFDALMSSPVNAPLLADLVDGTAASSPAERALEQEILAAWYTSVCVVDGRRHAASHAGALMWPAVGRPAPGTCAGTTGSWSTPPTIG